MDNEAIWLEYKTTHDLALRDRLILQYAPLVYYVAKKVASGLPQSVDQADLASYGMFGLIDAIEKFELERGFKFETYAITRIKGAILDELRSIDWVPRSVRAKARGLERAHQALESKLHRKPTEAEMAEEMGQPIETVRLAMGQVAAARTSSIDELHAGDDPFDNEAASSGAIIPDTTDAPGTLYELEELRQGFAADIVNMPERERIVLTLYYYEGLTLSDIGTALGVTESRVCQIHTRAVLHLKGRLGAYEMEPA